MKNILLAIHMEALFQLHMGEMFTTLGARKWFYRTYFGLEHKQ